MKRGRGEGRTNVKCEDGEKERGEGGMKRRRENGSEGDEKRGGNELEREEKRRERNPGVRKKEERVEGVEE